MASVSSCRTPLTMLVTQVASSLTRRWVLMRANSSDLFNGFLQGRARRSAQVYCVCNRAAGCCEAYSSSKGTLQPSSAQRAGAAARACCSPQSAQGAGAAARACCSPQSAQGAGAAASHRLKESSAVMPQATCTATGLKSRGELPLPVLHLHLLQG